MSGKQKLHFRWERVDAVGSWRIIDNAGGVHIASYYEADLIDLIESLEARIVWYESNLLDKRNPNYDPDIVIAGRKIWPNSPPRA